MSYDHKDLARRAAKDPTSLTPEELKALSEHPAGEVELSADDLETVAGGTEFSTEHAMTAGCCGGYTNPTTCVEKCKTSLTTELQ